MDQERSIGLPWAVIFGFLRLVAHPSVLVEPISAHATLERVRSWLSRSHVRILVPGPRYLNIVSELFAATGGVAASMSTDTHLAALAIGHQAELHSNGVDFMRFPGLRRHNPLA